MKRLLLLVAAIPVVTWAFSDVQNSEYREAIYDLKVREIVQGYPDGSFRPDSTINRAEFIKIVIGGKFQEELGRKSYQTQCFSDIENTTQWFVPYVCFAKEWGIIKGYDDGTFRPAQTINMVEAAKIIANTYNEEPSALRADPNLWHKPYVNYLLQNKMLPNALDHFDQLVTRGDMSEMISRAIRRSEGRLADYLQYRQEQYGETELPTWAGLLEINTPGYHEEPQEDFSGADIVRTGRTIVEGDHPGEYVGGNYISNYNQWMEASYKPTIDNNTLSLEDEDRLRSELLQLVNTERNKEGAGSLELDFTLTDMAQNFAEHLVANAIYSHTDMYGRDPFDRARDAGYEGFVTESIVWRKNDAQDAVNWWKGSSLHWNNISNPRYDQAGVGVVEEPGGGLIFVLMTGD